MKKNPTLLIVVAAALVAGDGRVLLQQRSAGRAMAGLWEFPGGKVEAGERPEEALVRELAEELGITVEEAALAPLAFASAPNDDRDMLLLLYRCGGWRGEPRALDAAQLDWVFPQDMGRLPMPPADTPFVERLKELAA